MTARELIEKYIDFFVQRGHKKLPNVSLIPENDPTTLFISAGMQPLVPYLLGEPHPLGKRLVSLQRCLRTRDIEEAGNVFHNTFFEMLGNWSLGDYWKKESLAWSYEFLTKNLGLNPKRLHVTIFKGNKNAPRDDESEKTWLSLGIPKERIYPLPKEDNWWEAGATGPGGPDSEIFYDIGKSACSPNCRPGDNCGRFFEMWNNVFMEYNRKSDGSYEKLKQRNVDTGMGVERTTAVLEGKYDIYQTELLLPIIRKIEEISGQKYEEENIESMRIIADHLRAAVFTIADGITPSNVEQGYILRRLIRRAIINGKSLGVEKTFIARIADTVIGFYQEEYPHLGKAGEKIREELKEEETKFIETFSPKRINEIESRFKAIKAQNLARLDMISRTGEVIFNSLATYGTALEISLDIAKRVGLIEVDNDEQAVGRVVSEKMEEHREVSRASLEKKFAGGLADRSIEATKLHTATHLLHAALREVLGKHVQQKGSNITPERLRFDFSHPEKLTEEELKKVEDLINQKIKEELPIKMEIVSRGEAKKQGALAFFGQKYGDKVKVYSVGSFSKEVCGGPHVTSTGQLGRVKITKSEKIGSGLQRIYAVLAN